MFFEIIVFIISVVGTRDINKIIYFGEGNANGIMAFNLFNNDFMLFSLYEVNMTSYKFPYKLYGMDSQGNDYFNDNGKNYKIFDLTIHSLNGIIIKVNNEEFPLICTYRKCLIIDYKDDEVYEKNIKSFFDERYDESSSSNLDFPLINMNNENKILFITHSNNGFNLGIVQINSKDLSSEQLLFNKFGNRVYFSLKSDAKLSCFITQKNLIECLYVDDQSYYNVAVFDFELKFLDNIILDNTKMVNSLSEGFYSCIHLKKEIGVFVYYLKPSGGPMKKYVQINELRKTDNNYIFNRIHSEDRIQIYINNPESFSTTIEPKDTDNLMKISDDRFIFIYLEYSHYAFAKIILVIFDLYNNDKNLIIKYYKINNNLNPTISNIIYYQLKSFRYNTFLGIEFLGVVNSVTIKTFFAICGYFEQNNNEIILNINHNFEWQINQDISINNNIFDYELSYKIKSVHDSLKGIKFYSVKYDKEISINEEIDYDDSILFDILNMDSISNDANSIEIEALINEPKYDKSLTLCDKYEIYGENTNSHYKSKLIDSKIYTVKLLISFSCYSTCETCYSIGIDINNQRCKSCKEDENFCFMENERNCYNITELKYNYYRTDTEINKLKCISLNEFCNNEYPFEIKQTKECIKECGFDDLINSDILPTNVPESIIKTFDTISNEIKTGSLDTDIENEIIIKGNNITIQATTSSNQKQYINGDVKTDLSIVDLSECEKKLGLDKPLIIIKMDINRKDNYPPQVEYMVINPDTHDKADLSACQDTKVDIYVPLGISQEDLKLIDYGNEQGYNMIDPNDKFYNDICSRFNSESNTDVLISDRKSDFFINETFCEDGCDIGPVNTNTNKVKCQCEIKNSINTDSNFSPKKLLDSFYKSNSFSNFKVIVCANLVFSLAGQKKNYGSYILLSIIFIFIIIMIISFITNEKKINNILNKILETQSKLIDINKNIINNNEGKDVNPIQIIKEVKPRKKGKRKTKRKRSNTQKMKRKHVSIGGNINNDIISNSKTNEQKIEINSQKTNNNIFSNQISGIGISMKKDHQDIQDIPAPHPPRKKHINIHNLPNSTKTNNEFGELISMNEINGLKNIIKNEPLKEKKAIETINNKTNNTNDNVMEIIIKNIEKKNRKNYFSNEELNSLEYKYAYEIDDRSYFQYYWSLLKLKHLIIFTFIANDDYNIFLLKIGFFLISLSLYFAVNTMFFTDDSIHQNYEEKGNYNFIYQIPQILYSTIISTVTNMVLKKLSLSQNDILKIKKNLDIQKAKEESQIIKKCLKIKFFVFIIISFILLFFFWYYISCFCSVFVNTQLPLIKDTVICYALSMAYPFGLNLLPGILRIPSLKKNDRQKLYTISKYLSLI